MLELDNRLFHTLQFFNFAIKEMASPAKRTPRYKRDTNFHSSAATPNSQVALRKVAEPELCPVCDDDCTCSLKRQPDAAPRLHDAATRMFMAMSDPECGADDADLEEDIFSSSDEAIAFHFAALSDPDDTSLFLETDSTDFSFDEEVFVTELFADTENPSDRLDELLYSPEDDLFSEDSFVPSVTTVDEHTEDSSGDEYERTPENVRRVLSSMDQRVLLEALREMSPSLFYSVYDNLRHRLYTREAAQICHSARRNTQDVLVETRADSNTSAIPSLALDELLYLSSSCTDEEDLCRKRTSNDPRSVLDKRWRGPDLYYEQVTTWAPFPEITEESGEEDLSDSSAEAAYVSVQVAR